MLFSLIEFLLTDQIYLQWLSNGILTSEMENHTIIVKSIEYPPLIIDPFGQNDQWIINYYNLQTIQFDDQYVFFCIILPFFLFLLLKDQMKLLCQLNNHFYLVQIFI
jgi:hypothetical protein